MAVRYTAPQKTGYIDNKGRAVRLIVGSAGSAYDHAETLAKMVKASPHLEFHVTPHLKDIGPRSVGGWMNAEKLNDLLRNGDGPLSLIVDINEYDGVGLAPGEADEAVLDIDRIDIFVRPRSENGPAGGCSLADNRCLSQALAQAFNGSMPPLKRAQQKIAGGQYLSCNKVLKKLCGLDERAKVPLDKIGVVESALANTAVHIHGETPELTRTSTRLASRQIHIRLKDEHYEIMAQPGRAQRMRRHSPDRMVVAIVGDYMMGSNGKAVPITPEQSRALKMETWEKDGRVCVLPFDGRQAAKYSDPVECMRVQLCQFQEERAAISKATGLDLLEYNARYKQLAQEHFRLHSKMTALSPPLTPVEDTWLCSAERGGLIISPRRTGFQGKTVKARAMDFVSFYPSILDDSHTILPQDVGKPTRMAPDEVRPFYTLGLYRATVTWTDAKTRQLWNQPEGRVAVFTNVDLNSALGYGALVRLDDAEGANAILYDRRKAVIAPDAFHGFVDEWYKMKCCGDPVIKRAAKKTLVMISGAMYEKRSGRAIMTPKQRAEILAGRAPPQVLPPGTQRMHSRQTPEGFSTTVKYRDEKDGIVHLDGPNHYPRWGAFMTAYGRRKMAKVLYDEMKRGAVVVRCHTDGALLTGGVPAVSSSVIGGWKLERSGTCVVGMGMTTPDWVN